MDVPETLPVSTNTKGEPPMGERSILEDSLFGARTVDQETLEQEVAIKAERELITQANEDDRRRLGKVRNEKEKLEYQFARARDQYQNAMTNREEISQRIEELKQNISRLNEDILDISQRIIQRDRQVEALSGLQVDTTEHRLPHESDREFLIRTGKITPFDNLIGIERRSSLVESEPVSVPSALPNAQKISAQNLRKPGFGDQDANEATCPSRNVDLVEDGTDFESSDLVSKSRGRKRESEYESDDDYVSQTSSVNPKRRKLVRRNKQSGVSPVMSEDSEDESESDVQTRKKRPSTIPKSIQKVRLDDGDEKTYQRRLQGWSSERSKAREKHGTHLDHEDQLEEWHMPHPTHPDQTFNGNFRLPGDIHPSLFDYQKISVQWLWELHCQDVGGILGDEMGLGKTIQIIAFIAGLHYSGMLDKPCIIIAPGAVLKQWASEFHTWWPALRVAILHSSGSGMLVTTADTNSDSDESGGSKATKTSKSAARKIVQRVFRDGHILVTTYEGLTTYGSILLDKLWAYAILDEGHRIRNPDARVSLTCKQLKTTHRLILSGTPVQNNLVELWSLFDFVYPGRLGTLPVFKEQFEVPIRIGGYKSATNIQVQTATKCAFVLRDMIGPYLLRRLKIDVMRDLPSKHEKVVFCRLTKGQHAKYLEYLKSPEVQQILDGGLKSLAGISVLRKLCSHPDLVDRESLINKPGYYYGHSSQSGKMQITKKMLLLWKEQGHRALLFSQSVKILDILEKDIKSYEGFKYRRMDGGTPIPLRQELVDEFNKDETINVFLMTTRVGGLGLNLTGADRVIIFDPDWNPSTDMQESFENKRLAARERAWRIGQRKSVSIFRLVAAGTIEEKMYNRQLFKQHLSQKVLSDAAQRRVFESDTLKDLFTLSSGGGGTSTGAMFNGAETVYGKDTSKPPAGDTSKTDNSELDTITGVSGMQDYKIQSNGGTGASNESGEKQFIDQIFTHAGVVSTLEHDLAVGSSLLDSTGSERYAAGIALAAAERLKESIKAAQSATLGTLTWTGRNGLAGKEEKVPKRASAYSLLKNLKNSTRDGSKNTGQASSDVDKRPLLYQMLDMFKQAGGKMSTPDIKVWCTDREIDKRHPDKAEEMRLVLRELAILNKISHEWELKSKFTDS
ncbi:DNA dependent ATPase [Geopyxis carbonaria]|nr:DNA dependent ATPase [Geopyxis carbonaria]